GWFEPSAANLKAVRALEQRECGAALVCKRAGAGLAQRAQAMIARAVVDLERDVDPPLARIERDIDPDRAVDELGRTREPIVAESCRESPEEFDRRGRPRRALGRRRRHH